MERAKSMRMKAFTSDAESADGDNGGSAGNMIGTLMHAASGHFFRKKFNPKEIQVMQRGTLQSSINVTKPDPQVVAQLGLTLLHIGFEKPHEQKLQMLYCGALLLEWAHKDLDFNSDICIKLAIAHSEIWVGKGVDAENYSLVRSKELFEKGEVMDSDNATDILEYARVLQFHGLYELASEVLLYVLQTLDSHENYPTFLLYAASLMKVLHRHDSAAKYFFDSLQVGPPKLFSKLDMMFLVSRNIEASNRDADEATNDAYQMVYEHLIIDGLLDASVSYDDWINDANTWRDIADKCLIIGLYSLATDLYAQAILRDSNAFKKPKFWFGFAKTCKRCGRTSDAQLAVKQALSIDPHNKQLQYAQRAWAFDQPVIKALIEQSDISKILQLIPPVAEVKVSGIKKFQACVRARFVKNQMKKAKSSGKNVRKLKSQVAVNLGDKHSLIFQVKSNLLGTIGSIQVFDVLTNKTVKLVLPCPFSPIHRVVGSPWKLTIAVDSKESSAITFLLRLVATQTGEYLERKVAVTHGAIEEGDESIDAEKLMNSFRVTYPTDVIETNIMDIEVKSMAIVVYNAAFLVRIHNEASVTNIHAVRSDNGQRLQYSMPREHIDLTVNIEKKVRQMLYYTAQEESIAQFMNYNVSTGLGKAPRKKADVALTDCQVVIDTSAQVCSVKLVSSTGGPIIGTVLQQAIYNEGVIPSMVKKEARNTLTKQSVERGNEAIQWDETTVAPTPASPSNTSPKKEVIKFNVVDLLKQYSTKVIPRSPPSSKHADAIADEYRPSTTVSDVARVEVKSDQLTLDTMVSVDAPTADSLEGVAERTETMDGPVLEVIPSAPEEEPLLISPSSKSRKKIKKEPVDGEEVGDEERVEGDEGGDEGGSEPEEEGEDVEGEDGEKKKKKKNRRASTSEGADNNDEERAEKRRLAKEAKAKSKAEHEAKMKEKAERLKKNNKGKEAKKLGGGGGGAPALMRKFAKKEKPSAMNFLEHQQARMNAVEYLRERMQKAVVIFRRQEAQTLLVNRVTAAMKVFTAAITKYESDTAAKAAEDASLEKKKNDKMKKKKLDKPRESIRLGKKDKSQVSFAEGESKDGEKVKTIPGLASLQAALDSAEEAFNSTMSAGDEEAKPADGVENKAEVKTESDSAIPATTELGPIVEATDEPKIVDVAVDPTVTSAPEVTDVTSIEVKNTDETQSLEDEESEEEYETTPPAPVKRRFSPYKDGSFPRKKNTKKVTIHEIPVDAYESAEKLVQALQALTQAFSKEKAEKLELHTSIAPLSPIATHKQPDDADELLSPIQSLSLANTVGEQGVLGQYSMDVNREMMDPTEKYQDAKEFVRKILEGKNNTTFELKALNNDETRSLFTPLSLTSSSLTSHSKISESPLHNPVTFLHPNAPLPGPIFKRSIENFKSKGFVDGKDNYAAHWRKKVHECLQLFPNSYLIKKTISSLQKVCTIPITRTEAFCALADSNGSVCEALGKFANAEFYREVKLVCALLPIDSILSVVMSDVSTVSSHDVGGGGSVAKSISPSKLEVLKGIEPIVRIHGIEAAQNLPHMNLTKDAPATLRRGLAVKLVTKSLDTSSVQFPAPLDSSIEFPQSFMSYEGDGSMSRVFEADSVATVQSPVLAGSSLVHERSYLNISRSPPKLFKGLSLSPSEVQQVPESYSQFVQQTASNAVKKSKLHGVNPMSKSLRLSSTIDNILSDYNSKDGAMVVLSRRAANFAREDELLGKSDKIKFQRLSSKHRTGKAKSHIEQEYSSTI